MLPPRLLSGTVVGIFGRVLGTLVSVATLALITRAFIAEFGAHGGVAAYGAYATVLAYVAVVGVVSDGGLYLLFTRQAARDDAREGTLLETIWVLRVGTIALGALGAVGISFLLPYSRVVRLGIALALLGMACQLGSQLFLGIFQKRVRLLTPALAEVFGRVVQFLLVALAVRGGGGILPLLGAFVAGTAATFVWNVVGARRFVRFRLSLFPPVPWAVCRRLLREAWPLALSLVLSVIFFKIDSVLLSILRPARDVALYALPYKILESLLFFPAMVGGLLLPPLAKAAAATPRGLATPLQSALELYLLGALPAAILLFAVSPVLVLLLGGPSYAEAVPVLQILAVTLGFLFVGNLFGTAVIAVGDQRRLVSMYAVVTVVNVGANLLVIPRYSYLGAAWTTLATEILSVALAGGILLARGVRVRLTVTTGKILLAGLLLVLLTRLPVPGVLPALLAACGYVLALFWLRVLRLASLRALLAAQRI